MIIFLFLLFLWYFKVKLSFVWVHWSGFDFDNFNFIKIGIFNFIKIDIFDLILDFEEGKSIGLGLFNEFWWWDCWVLFAWYECFMRIVWTCRFFVFQGFDDFLFYLEFIDRIWWWYWVGFGRFIFIFWAYDFIFRDIFDLIWSFMEIHLSKKLCLYLCMHLCMYYNSFWIYFCFYFFIFWFNRFSLNLILVSV